MSIREWILLCVPVLGTIRRKELEEACLIEGFTESSIGHTADSLVLKGRLVKVSPGLYRRPTNHEANP